MVVFMGHFPAWLTATSAPKGSPATPRPVGQRQVAGRTSASAARCTTGGAALPSAVPAFRVTARTLRSVESSYLANAEAMLLGRSDQALPAATVQYTGHLLPSRRPTRRGRRPTTGSEDADQLNWRGWLARAVVSAPRRKANATEQWRGSSAQPATKAGRAPHAPPPARAALATRWKCQASNVAPIENPA